MSIIETLVMIGIVSMLLIMIIGMVNLLQLQKSGYYRTVARQLIVEESESLRNASFADLHNRSNTQFIEVAYNTGVWSVEQPANPKSAPRVYQVASASGTTNPSRQVVPTGTLGDGTYQTSFRVQNSAPAGWDVGLYLRYHDDQNHYLLRASESTLAFLRVVEGVSTQVWSTTRTFAKNVWYDIAVTATGNSFTVSVDGVPAAGTPFSDGTSAFSRGHFVLGAFDGAAAEFDSVTYTGTVSVLWDFDGANETVGKQARGWRRTGPSDLPSATTAITITDAIVTYTDLKQAVLTVSWDERGAARSLSNTFYINERSVAP